MPPIVRDSFADVVDLSYDPAHDGYDGIDPNDRKSLFAAIASPFRGMLPVSAAPSASPTIVVPYRIVGQGDENWYVYAVKRAYARWKGHGRLRKLENKPLPVRKRWGNEFSEEIGSTKYTKTLHQKLAPYYDAYALELVRRSTSASARDIKIAKQVGWLNALYNRRSMVAYSQVRPSQLGEASRITRGDCSGGVAGSCHWADILNEVDWRYTNTFVQIQFGREIDGVADAIVGDVFLYGSPSHEALYLGEGLVWSFGSYPIKILRHDYRHDRCAIRRFLPL